MTNDTTMILLFLGIAFISAGQGDRFCSTTAGCSLLMGIGGYKAFAYFFG